MAQISEQNTENAAQQPSAPPHSTAVSGEVLGPGMSAGLPSPLAETTADLPAHLKDLTDRACVYVESPSREAAPDARAIRPEHRLEGL